MSVMQKQHLLAPWSLWFGVDRMVDWQMQFIDNLSRHQGRVVENEWHRGVEFLQAILAQPFSDGTILLQQQYLQGAQERLQNASEAYEAIWVEAGDKFSALVQDSSLAADEKPSRAVSKVKKTSNSESPARKKRSPKKANHNARESHEAQVKTQVKKSAAEKSPAGSGHAVSDVSKEKQRQPQQVPNTTAHQTTAVEVSAQGGSVIKNGARVDSGNTEQKAQPAATVSMSE